MTGGHLRLDTELIEDSRGCNGMNERGGLGYFGLAEAIGGAVALIEHYLAQRKTEDVVGLFENVAGVRVCFNEIRTHDRVLRDLPRKEKSSDHYTADSIEVVSSCR